MIRHAARAVLSHLLLCLVSFAFWPYFFLLNRTVVRGLRGVRITPNTLLVANHQSSIDSVLISVVACFPACVFRPRLMPWHLAAAEHFFSTPVRAGFSRLLRCIPVHDGRSDAAALRRLLGVLPGGVAVCFPEGHRSRGGGIGDFKPGVGVLALSSQARVIPVGIDGMGEVVRFDRFGLRFFRRIRISFGAPVDLSAFAGRAPDRRSAREAAAAIMEGVRAQHRTLAEA